VTPKNCSSATLYVCVHAHTAAYTSSNSTSNSSNNNNNSSSSGATSSGGVSPLTVEKERYAPTAGNCEFISSTPLKPPLLASMKSTNYLLNALCAMDSEGGGGCLGTCVLIAVLVSDSGPACTTCSVRHYRFAYACCAVVDVV
jgi:hypothetical protein